MPATTYLCDYIINHPELGWRQHKLKHEIVISGERKVSSCAHNFSLFWLERKRRSRCSFGTLSGSTSFFLLPSSRDILLQAFFVRQRDPSKLSSEAQAIPHVFQAKQGTQCLISARKSKRLRVEVDMVSERTFRWLCDVVRR